MYLAGQEMRTVRELLRLLHTRGNVKTSGESPCELSPGCLDSDAGTWAALRAALDDGVAAEGTAAAALRSELAEARGVGPAALEGLLELARDAEDADVADRLAARLALG